MVQPWKINVNSEAPDFNTIIVQENKMRRIKEDDPEFRSTDVFAENIEKLKALFPEAFSEGKVDFEVLNNLLKAFSEESEEKYGLNWHGKHKARQLALTPSTGTLRPCPEESVDWDTTKHLMIEGDNLEVLKLLQKSYVGKVKLIYIDPPYNTGKDFIYPDSFHDNIRNYLKLTGQTDDENRRLSSNTETSGRFHTDWLNMMYPRLKVARNLLSEDGVIVCSISDAEIGNLRTCLDELFGADNFIGCVVWNSTKSVTNTALISVSHTYNLIYSRDKDYFIRNRVHFRLREEGEGFSNPDNDPRGPWKADPFQVGGERPNQMYPITNPKTGEVYLPNEGNSWKNQLSVFEQLMEENRIVFGVSGEAGPQRKRFLSEAEERGKVAKTWWDDIETTANATIKNKELMGASVFENPKPISLIQRFIQLGTHDPAMPIVMDFFSGLGTTGHAVMAQNALDGGKRRYIVVQLPEQLDSNSNNERAATDLLKNLGRPHNIAELTKERLRRAAVKVKDDNPKVSGDFGFRVFKLDTSNIRSWEPDRDDLEGSLLDNVEHIKVDRSENDILYELLLKLGLDLCVPIETRIIADKSVHSVGAGTLIACLDKSINESDIEGLAHGIAEWQEEIVPAGETTVVFRDSAFTNDTAKTNLTAILEQLGLGNVRSL